jgi:hypothetical protein
MIERVGFTLFCFCNHPQYNYLNSLHTLSYLSSLLVQGNQAEIDNWMQQCKQHKLCPVHSSPAKLSTRTKLTTLSFYGVQTTYITHNMLHKAVGPGRSVEDLHSIMRQTQYKIVVSNNCIRTKMKSTWNSLHRTHNDDRSTFPISSHLPTDLKINLNIHSQSKYLACFPVYLHISSNEKSLGPRKSNLQNKISTCFEECRQSLKGNSFPI